MHVCVYQCNGNKRSNRNYEITDNEVLEWVLNVTLGERWFLVGKNDKCVAQMTGSSLNLALLGIGSESVWLEIWMWSLKNHYEHVDCCYLVTKLCPTLWTHRQWPARLLCLCSFPGKNTGVGCHFLFQGIFPTQGSNQQLLHWQGDSVPLSHQWSPS